MFDKFKDECGVFGIFGHPEAANMTYLGPVRAPASRAGERRHRRVRRRSRCAISRAMGYVADIFDGDDARQRCPGRSRSATCAIRRPARASCSNAQPILIDCAHGQIAIVPQRQPRQRAASCATSSCSQGSIFQSSSDTEVMLHLYARSKARTRRGRDRRIGVAGPGRVFAGDADARTG